ncbi:MAG: hypothetical protein M2R45_02309 [Verrucomicrobia subdivision 3 bacterium]|nr:hypothetical protein [Limisphaerales bacterium]MCS1414688.1 hypothetical protein [Limisphaerales bacterium]
MPMILADTQMFCESITSSGDPIHSRALLAIQAKEMVVGIICDMVW